MRWGGRESVAGLSGHSLTAKGGNRGCWSGCLGGGFAGDQTDRRASTAFLIDLGNGRTVDMGIIGLGIFPSARNGNNGNCGSCGKGGGFIVRGKMCNFVK